MFHSFLPLSAFSRIAAIALVASAVTLADERATITGRVQDSNGQPVEHATVLVYEATVRKGYSTYCPTCWVDCGKHVVTDKDGKYSIAGVSSELLFTLLVMHDGDASQYVKKVDPVAGVAATAVLKPRLAVTDTAQVVRGRVVNADGQPVHDAVVEQQGVTFKGVDGRVGTMFGGPDWLDALAVTNANGEFELAYGKPAISLIMQVKPRAMAPKLVTLPTGAERHTIRVSDGATVRGRLMYNGKPVTEAELGITTVTRRAGHQYAEARIGTRDDGTFTITNVPAQRVWYLYPKSESLEGRGLAAEPVALETQDDGETVNVGDIQLIPAGIVRGRVMLTDNKPIPPDMRVAMSGDRGLTTQMTTIGTDGSFTFRGVLPGAYSLFPAVRGYRLQGGVDMVEVLAKPNGHEVVIRMEPAPPRP